MKNIVPEYIIIILNRSLKLCLFIVFCFFLILPCWAMELPFTEEPIEICDAQEYIVDIPPRGSESPCSQHEHTFTEELPAKVSQEVLEDVLLQETFDAIEHVSIEQLEGFVCQTVDKLLPPGVPHDVEGDGLRTLRQMIHDCLLFTLQIHKEILPIYTTTVLSGDTPEAKKNREDHKERMALIQSIFFYVIYYLRSIDQVNKNILQPHTMKVFLLASFELAVTMLTDVDYDVMPFSGWEKQDPQKFMCMRERFKQNHSVEYPFLQAVIRHKMRICYLLLRKDIFMTMPLSKVIKIAQEFQQFIKPC